MEYNIEEKIMSNIPITWLSIDGIILLFGLNHFEITFLAKEYVV